MPSSSQKRQAAMWAELQLEEALRLERARRGLLNFTRFTKPNYQVNWHHRLMAAKLNQIVDGTLTRLIITVPPRHGKSELVSVRFPAYLFGRQPKAQVIAASYNATLAGKMNRAVQRVIDSPDYRQLFPETTLSGKAIRSTSEGNWLRNTDEFEIVGHGGFYRSAGVGGSATGYGATVGLIDDFVKNREEANSQTYRERNWDWYTSTFYSRLEKNGAMIICATRWHEDDLIGRLLQQAKENPKADQWTVLNLPAYAEDTENSDDPRQPGEPLWPGKYDKEKLELIRNVQGERNWVSLYQQRPAPAEGQVVKNSWWRFWRELPVDVDYLCASADLNAKDRDTSDFTVITVWARSGPNFYLIDMVRDRMGWIEQKRALERVTAQYPDLNAVFIEDAANGIALIQEARSTVPGVVAVTPRGSKITRLEAVSALIEAGNVFLPDVTLPGYEWSQKVQDEVGVFPSGAHDDIVDSLSQALSQMRLKARDFSFSLDVLEKASTTRGLHDLTF